MNIEKEYEKQLSPVERYLINQCALLDEALEKIKKSKSGRLHTLATLACQVISFSQSTTVLARGGKISELYLLSRSILDSCTNYCYMLVADDEEFKRFVDFSKRNIGRGLETRAKAFEAIGQTIDLPNLRKIDPFKEAFDQFTSSKKRVDITRWETEKSSNIGKKLEKIESEINGFNRQLFEAACQFIYEDASEIAHGTLYGSMHVTGTFAGSKDFRAAVKYAFGVIRTLFLVNGALIDAMLIGIDHFQPIEEIKNKAKRNFNDLDTAFNTKKI